MKRFCLLGFSLLLGVLLHAKNKISMVTYFPVPYVAYSQINAEQIDAGLTSTCDMKLGCDESSVPLSVKTVNLTSGRLDLNGGLGVKGNSLELGSGSGAGHIAFQNVRIQTGAMQSVHAGSVNVEELSLFGKKFPSCKAVNAAGNGKMQWQSLKLAGAAGSELYLVCGSISNVQTVCSNTPSKLTESRECATGTGTQTRTWNASSCSWGAWEGTCVTAAYSWKRYPDGDCWTMLGNTASITQDNWLEYRGDRWDCAITPGSDSIVGETIVDPFGVGSECSSYASRLASNLGKIVYKNVKDCTQAEQNSIYLKYDAYAGSAYGRPRGASGCFAYVCERDN